MNGRTSRTVRVLLCAAIAATVLSCGKKRPEGILTPAEMVQVLEEMYVAEEKINQLGLRRDSAKKVFAVMEKKVFENLPATDSTFKRSFDYYMEHPRQMEMIYTALVDTLQLREQRAPFGDPQ